MCSSRGARNRHSPSSHHRCYWPRLWLPLPPLLSGPFPMIPASAHTFPAACSSLDPFVSPAPCISAIVWSEVPDGKRRILKQERVVKNKHSTDIQLTTIRVAWVARSHAQVIFCRVFLRRPWLKQDVFVVLYLLVRSQPPALS